MGIVLATIGARLSIAGEVRPGAAKSGIGISASVGRGATVDPTAASRSASRSPRAHTSGRTNWCTGFATVEGLGRTCEQLLVGEAALRREAGPGQLGEERAAIGRRLEVRVTGDIGQLARPWREMAVLPFGAAVAMIAR
jgi:hypothetical protein